MDIVFGLWADGGASPDHGSGEAGAVGAPVVGPNGLLNIPEMRYGLSAPPSAFVVRIAPWQAALEAADDRQRFWSRSLEVDALGRDLTLIRVHLAAEPPSNSQCLAHRPHSFDFRMLSEDS